MLRKRLLFLPLACAVVLLAGCPHGTSEYNLGKKAEAVQDYDTALVHYNRALTSDPTNTEYKLKSERMRFEAAQHHVEIGQQLQKKGDLQTALAEFQKALMLDPASAIAEQETQGTIDTLNAQKTTAGAPSAAPTPAASQEPQLMPGPPELKPLSQAPITLKMTADAKMVFDTISKLAGVTVIFDPDFVSRRVTVELTDVTLQQALDVTTLQAKAFWKPETSNIIFVIPDNAQKRRDYEEEIIQTVYLKNTILPQDITEIINGLRQLLDLRRISQFNAENAIIIRDTPDKILLAEKIIDDVDKPKSEVVIQFDVLQVERNRMRDLGINPGTSASLTFSPPSTTSTSSTTSTTTTATAAGVVLSQIKGLSTADYSLTLPSATANALLTDSATKIIDDPQVRVVDGQEAKLTIGERVPIATGSFQAGVGVGTTGTAGGVINPLVNTQFTYLDVGVKVDVTPRIHVDSNEVSLKLTTEVSSVSGEETIGGIQQPIISTKQIEHDVRLEDGEVNILGGLIEHTDTKSTSGVAGLDQIPILKYLFSDNQVSSEDQEVLIVVTPHIVRLPGITAENLRTLASGSDTNPTVHLESEVMSPPIPVANNVAAPAAPGAPAGTAAAAVAPTAQPGGPGQPAPSPATTTQGAMLRFEPASAALKPGDTATIGLVVEDVQDLFSMPLLLQFDPKVLSIEDIRQGGFLSGGTQPVPIVSRVDKDRGQAIISATRMPNTPGISGTGTLFGVVVRAVGPGSSRLSIVQVNARDSQQRSIAFVTSEAAVSVQP